jgi:hypothetical protein
MNPVTGTTSTTNYSAHGRIKMSSRMYLTVVVTFDDDLTEEQMDDIVENVDYSFMSDGKELNTEIREVDYG